MSADLSHGKQLSAMPDKYLAVTHNQDGRYCVQFIKQGFAPRTSYVASTTEVIQQAQRAGGLSVHTDDEALQHACRAQQTPLI